MEAEAHYVIPAVSKDRISRLLSWPIGAERLSFALASVPQLRLLSLQFVQYRYGKMPITRYPVLSTFYIRDENTFKSVTGEIVSTEWRIYVHPVRRQFRHRIQEHMLAVGIKMAAQWFKERSDLCLQGYDNLIFFYDEAPDTFSIETKTGLQPLTGPKIRQQPVP